MTAFDELQQQLLESVGARSRPRPFPGAVALARWLRERAGSGAAVLAGAILIVLVAVSAHRPGTGSGGLDAGLTAPVAGEAAAAVCGGCGAVGGRLHGPVSEETLTGTHERATASRRPPGVRWVPASGQAGTGHFG
jgi:hypothetical protein